jgi:hypothetical protein
MKSAIVYILWATAIEPMIGAPLGSFRLASPPLNATAKVRDVVYHDCNHANPCYVTVEPCYQNPDAINWNGVEFGQWTSVDVEVSNGNGDFDFYFAGSRPTCCNGGDCNVQGTTNVHYSGCGQSFGSENPNWCGTFNMWYVRCGIHTGMTLHPTRTARAVTSIGPSYTKVPTTCREIV